MYFQSFGKRCWLGNRNGMGPAKMLAVAVAKTYIFWDLAFPEVIPEKLIG